MDNIEQKQVTATRSFLPSSSLPKQPQTFQFRIIADIHKQVYERLLGYRVEIKEVKDKAGNVIGHKSESTAVFEPLITEWGANRIITLIYQFINEQTPFAHITSQTVVKMTNIFCKQLNSDLYSNFEKYFIKEQRNVTMWRMVLTTVGFIVLLILSRSIEGRESQMFYQQGRFGFTGVVQPQQGGLG